jgi:hypothetical protein
VCAQRDHTCAGCEKFPFSCQVRPSAAAADRRAGPVLAPLRAADPAAAHSRKPDDPENKSSHRSPGLPSARAELVWRCLGLSSPSLIVSRVPVTGKGR